MSLLFEPCQKIGTKRGHNCRWNGVGWSPDDTLHARKAHERWWERKEGQGTGTASRWAKLCRYFPRNLVRTSSEVIHCRWSTYLSR